MPEGYDDKSINFFLGGIQKSLESIEGTIKKLCCQLEALEKRQDNTERRVTVIETKFLVYASILGFAMWFIPLALNWIGRLIKP